MEGTREIQCEGIVDDVAVPSESDSVGPGSQSIRKVAGLGETDTADSADDDSGEGSGAAFPDIGSTRGDDDALSVHSSGSDARHDLDYLRDKPGGLLSYLVMAS